MVHLTINGQPICDHGFQFCQYGTRTEAVEQILKNFIAPNVVVVTGRCPRHAEKEG